MVYKRPALIPHSLNRVGLLVTADNENYPLITYSNSTIENVYFNNADKSINIILSMSVKTTGFVFVKLPESFIKSEWNGKIEVRLNNIPWQYNKITANPWIYIHLTYQEGLKEIIITPEFANYLISIVTLTASTLLYSIYMRAPKNFQPLMAECSLSLPQGEGYIIFREELETIDPEWTSEAGLYPTFEESVGYVIRQRLE
jgi:hypothetical protein